MVEKSDLNTKLVTLTTKAELKAEQDKIVRLKTYDSSYFVGKMFFLVMIVYQPTLNTSVLKEDNGTDYVIILKLEDLIDFKVLPLHITFLSNIK